MRTRIQKWGNSLAVRLPKSFATEAGLSREASVDVTLEDGRIVVTPAAEPEYTLSELLAEVTPENLHGEVDAGPAVGEEAW